MKFLTAVLLTILYIVALLAIYVVHAWYFPVNVIFYSALVDAALAAAVVAGILFLTRLGAALTAFEKMLLIVIWLLGGYAFAISIPTVLDRSLSFYILEKLQQRGGAIRKDRFDDVFVKEYVPESHLVDVRLTEQLQSGTITIDDGCVKLTERGQRIATFSRYFRKNFLAQHRLLGDQYTDVLTDPLAASDTGTTMDYECR